jgi:hypothetical protein
MKILSDGIDKNLRAVIGWLWRQQYKRQAVGFLLTIVSLGFVYFQLREINHTNKVTIRGQLYDRQIQMGADMTAPDAEILSAMWALVPSQLQPNEVARTFLSLATSDPTALKATNPAELYHSMFDLPVFADRSRSKGTQLLRRLFVYTQDNFYHVHNIFDYQRDGILSQAEWRTWKGTVREMHAHPMLLTVIWQGYENRYFSRQFARWLHTELCPNEIPPDVSDIEAFKRDREFARSFYPEMTRPDWPDALPDY